MWVCVSGCLWVQGREGETEVPEVSPHHLFPSLSDPWASASGPPSPICTCTATAGEYIYLPN